MNKLSTLFAIAAMSATLGAAGCKTKNTETKETAAKPTETVPPATTTPPATTPPATTTKPEEMTPSTTPATTPSDLPAECAEYKASIDKLATCDKLPQATRDSLKQSYEETSKTWATTPAEGKAALGASCKSAVDAVKQAAASTCGW